jgi:protease I
VKYVKLPVSLDRRGTDYTLPVFPPADPSMLKGLRVAILSADCPELPEIDVPLTYLRERGATVLLVGQDWIFQYREPAGMIVIGEWLASDIGVQADLSITQARAQSFDALVIPGGAWNPDMLRSDDNALAFVRECHTKGVLIASLCHGPQVLINAAVFPRGTNLTGTASIRADLHNAGFTVHNDDAVVYESGQRLITSRDPNDLGPFCEEIGRRLTTLKSERNTTVTIKVGNIVYVPESVTLPGMGEGDKLEVVSVSSVVRFKVLSAHSPSRIGSEYEVRTSVVESLIAQRALIVE